jgi:hypothetical protein
LLCTYTHAGLGGHVRYALGLKFLERPIYGVGVGKIGAQMGVAGMRGEAGQARFLQRRVVVIVVIVDAVDLVASGQ